MKASINKINPNLFFLLRRLLPYLKVMRNPPSHRFLSIKNVKATNLFLAHRWCEDDLHPPKLIICEFYDLRLTQPPCAHSPDIPHLQLIPICPLPRRGESEREGFPSFTLQRYEAYYRVANFISDISSSE